MTAPIQLSQKIYATVFSSIMFSFMIISSLSVTQAAGDDGVFGDYFTNIVKPCLAGEVVTGFKNSNDSTYGTVQCTTLKSLLGSLFGASSGPVGQAVVGFNADGSMKYAHLFWTQPVANTIAYVGDVIIGGTLRTGDIFTRNITATGNVTIGQNLNVTGNSTIGGNLQVSGRIDATSMYINGKAVSTVPTPTTCNGANQALQWNGSSWNCTTIQSTTTTPPPQNPTPVNDDPTGVYGIFDASPSYLTFSRSSGNYNTFKVSGAKLEDIEWCGTISAPTTSPWYQNNGNCNRYGGQGGTTYQKMVVSPDASYNPRTYVYSRTLNYNTLAGIIDTTSCVDVHFFKNSTGEKKIITACGRP